VSETSVANLPHAAVRQRFDRCPIYGRRQYKGLTLDWGMGIAWPQVAPRRTRGGWVVPTGVTILG